MNSVEFDEQTSYRQDREGFEENRNGLAGFFIGLGLVKSEKGANFLGLFLAVLLIAVAFFIFSFYLQSTEHIPIPVQISR